MKYKVYVALGSNMGNKAEFLRQAARRLRLLAADGAIRLSSLWQTAAWGTEAQEDYLNAVAELQTEQSPMQLLKSLQQIEQALGRQRPYHWAPRTIDLDILLYGNEVIQQPELHIPHPFMRERMFVLAPLYELAPTLVFPDGSRLAEVYAYLKQKEGLQGVQKTHESWEKADGMGNFT